MSKINLAQLKKSLSECHLTKEDKKTRFLLDVENPSYYLHRVMECIASCEAGEDVLENTKLAIQLLNLYRVRYGAVESTEGTTGGTGSSDPRENNSSPSQS